jgi:nucleotide-binding universal stress UspA family protein
MKIEFASKLAHESNSRLSIIHITPMLPTTKEEMITLLKDEIGSPKKAGEKYLASGKSIAEKFDLKPKLILKEGNPVEVILEEVGKYDMIVVGSYGKGKIDRLIPVVVVR